MQVKSLAAILLSLSPLASAGPVSPPLPNNFNSDNLDNGNNNLDNNNLNINLQFQGGRPSFTSPNAARYPNVPGYFNRDPGYYSGMMQSCRAAQRANVRPLIDCSYTSLRINRDSITYWSVRIEPGNVAWYDTCSGLYDAIRRRCPVAADCNSRSPGCYCDRQIQGSPRQAPGTQFYFPIRTSSRGEAFTVQCVQDAIRDALCGQPRQYNTGRCYRNPGFLNVGYQQPGYRNLGTSF